MDLRKLPFFDNHSHPLQPQLTAMTADELALQWLHGYRDLPGGKVSPWLNRHVHEQGVVTVMTHLLSRFLGCGEDLGSIAEARARCLENGVKAYAEDLYRDAGIFCTVIDSDLPWQDPQVDLIPGRLLRHIQMDPIFFSLLADSNGFADMKERFSRTLRDMAAMGYASIKSHVGEKFTMDVRYVSDEEAESSWQDARLGDKNAQRTLYYAIFRQAMLDAGDLGITIHVHSGITGGFWDGRMDDCDPWRMAPFLRDVPHMQETDLVLLHSNYPYTGGAAMMAQTFPHVFVDLAWVLPWTALAFDRALEDLLAVAPASKILLGSGQHNIPEIAWLAAHVARRSLERVTDRLVQQDLISPDQGLRIAEQILFRNACDLYGVPAPQDAER